MIYVIGSGPSGIACARALVRRGHAVTVLDVGTVLEEPRVRQRNRLASLSPASWRSADTTFLRDGIRGHGTAIPLKRAYGSDFPYRGVQGAARFDVAGAGLRPSYARAGLSNVWGATVMPYRQDDIQDWPITVERLAPYYREIFDFMPLAGVADPLASDFPLYSTSATDLPMSNQAKSLLAHWRSREGRLKRKGIQFGKARTAVRANWNGHCCVRCGMCMYGCPYELIFSTAATLEELQTTATFRYIPNYHVVRVDEAGAVVNILATDTQTGQPTLFRAERVFLACGVLETTTVLLRSLDMYDRSISIRDSQYFLLPVLRTRNTSGARAEALHTLAQLFVEITDPRMSPFTVHLQTYTYNELFEASVRDVFGPLARMLPTDGLISRLLLFQGYLHSAHSGTLGITLSRESGRDVIHVRGQQCTETRSVLRKLIIKLLAASLDLGLLPLVPLLRVAEPGRGYHCGGSFPMRNLPALGETDAYGRPHGLRRVHAVDATIFPSVPATTITLTVMANAARIAAEFGSYA